MRYGLATLALFLPVLALALFLPVLALAQVPDDPGGIATGIIEAIRGGNWKVAAVLVVVGVVWVIRRYGVSFMPWLATDRGGAVLALVVGLVGTLAPALLNGPVTFNVVLNALWLGFTAAGSWSVVKKILGK